MRLHNIVSHPSGCASTAKKSPVLCLFFLPLPFLYLLLKLLVPLPLPLPHHQYYHHCDYSMAPVVVASVYVSCSIALISSFSISLLRFSCYVFGALLTISAATTATPTTTLTLSGCCSTEFSLQKCSITSLLPPFIEPLNSSRVSPPYRTRASDSAFLYSSSSSSSSPSISSSLSLSQFLPFSRRNASNTQLRFRGSSESRHRIPFRQSGLCLFENVSSQTRSLLSSLSLFRTDVSRPSSPPLSSVSRLPLSSASRLLLSSVSRLLLSGDGSRLYFVETRHLLSHSNTPASRRMATSSPAGTSSFSSCQSRASTATTNNGSTILSTCLPAFTSQSCRKRKPFPFFMPLVDSVSSSSSTSSCFSSFSSFTSSHILRYSTSGLRPRPPYYATASSTLVATPTTTAPITPSCPSLSPPTSPPPCSPVPPCNSRSSSLPLAHREAIGTGSLRRFFRRLWCGVKVVVEFGRPHTLLGSFLAVLSSHALAAPKLPVMVSPNRSGASSWRPLSSATDIAGPLHSSSLVPSTERQTGSSFRQVMSSVIGGLLPVLSVNVFVTGLNQIVDFPVDCVNKPYLPLPAGSLTRRQAKTIVAVALLNALAFCIPVPGNSSKNLPSSADTAPHTARPPSSGPSLLAAEVSAAVCRGARLLASATKTIWTFPARTTAITTGVLAAALFGSQYSIGPLRLRRWPIAAAFAVLVTRGLFANLCFYSHAKVAAFRANPTNFIGFCLDRRCLLVTTFFGIYALIIAISKDASDVHGDRRFDVDTYCVRHGTQKVFKYCCYQLSALFLSAASVLVLSALEPLLLVYGHTLGSVVGAVFAALWKKESTFLQREVSTSSELPTVSTDHLAQELSFGIPGRGSLPAGERKVVVMPRLVRRVGGRLLLALLSAKAAHWLPQQLSKADTTASQNLHQFYISKIWRLYYLSYLLAPMAQ